MKSKLGFVIWGLITINTFAQENINWKGYLQPDHRLNINNGDWLWNENRLDLEFDKLFEEKAKITADIWIRNMGFYNEKELIKITDIREAKVEIYDFLIPKLDLSVGRQRIKWGTADKINPTDNINPYDLEDIWDFGRHKPSDAIALKYYPKEDAKIEAVFIPLFQKANLPIGIYSDVLMPEFIFPDSINISQKPGYPPIPLPNKTAIIVDTINLIYQLPEMILKSQASFAFKIGKQVKGIDLSLSYRYGYDGLPIATDAFVSIDSLNFEKKRTYVTVTPHLIYPKFHNIGFDFTTSIKGIGFWGEACLTLPEKTYKLTTHLPDINQVIGLNLGIAQPQIPDSIIFDKEKPWLRYVIGFDYTFINGIYTNVQYAHGFFHERGSEELNDYYLLRIEKKFFN